MNQQQRNRQQVQQGPSCWTVAKQGALMGGVSGLCLGVVMGGGQTLISKGSMRQVLRNAGLVRKTTYRASRVLTFFQGRIGNWDYAGLLSDNWVGDARMLLSENKKS